jgi:hypothetical protein
MLSEDLNKIKSNPKIDRSELGTKLCLQHIRSPTMINWENRNKNTICCGYAKRTFLIPFLTFFMFFGFYVLYQTCERWLLEVKYMITPPRLDCNPLLDEEQWTTN